MTRSGTGNDVVIPPEEDAASLQETAYLLRSPANAKRLLAAVERDRVDTYGCSLDRVLAELALTSEEV